MRGVSLEEVSAATRISTRFLEAIENEQWDQLPGGVFNRGFIRSIARFLGLDEDGLVAEYALETKGEAEKPHLAAPTPEIPRDWRPVIVTVVVAVALLGGLVAYFEYRSKIVARLHRHAPAVSGTASGSTSAAVSVQPTATDPNKGRLPASGEPHAPVTAGRNGSQTSAPLLLKLEAGKPAQVKVTGDGQTLFDGPVKANDVKQFNASEKFEIQSSDSSAVLLELNGEAVPPIGAPGQPGSITLTQSDLKPPVEATH